MEAYIIDLLKLERVVLNFLQYLSGIATETSRLVSNYPGLRILDTRKTLPGYRKLVKYAVYCGGGWNHRQNLSDMALIKDNHLSVSSIVESVSKIRDRFPEKKIEVEVDNFTQLKEAISSTPDLIMLDNFQSDDIKKAVIMIREISPEIMIECSGSMTPEKLKNISDLKDIGVSMGYLTHTTRFLDLSLEIQ